jgi:thiol-disulfide isomerase/thioredoxin
LRLSFYLFLLLSILSCGSKEKEPTQLKNEVQLPSITFHVKISSGNKFFLNYLDSNFKDANVGFINNKDSSTHISKTVNALRPTVFNYYTFPNAKLTRNSILAVPGDTINFTVAGSTIHVNFTNPLLDSLNKLLLPIAEKKRITKTAFTNFDSLYNFEQNTMLANQSYIMGLPNQNSISKGHTQAFMLWNKLQFLRAIFNLDYDHIAPRHKDVIAILQGKQDTLCHDSVLGKIATTDVKDILQNLLRLSCAQKGIKPTNIFNDVKHGNPCFFHTKYLSGLLLDAVDIESHTLLEKQNKLDAIKNYIDTTFLHLSLPVQAGVLGDSVLTAPIIDAMGNTKQLKDAIETTKKLILVDFWASWCVPCIGEMPALKKVAFKHAKELQVISISIDDARAIWEKACKKYQLKGHSYLIAAGKRNPLVRFFEISTIPRYILLNNKGAVISADFYRPSDPKFEISLMETYRSLH